MNYSLDYNEFIKFVRFVYSIAQEIHIVLRDDL